MEETFCFYRSFIDYLNRLETSANPFNCPHLRILPEDIKIMENSKGNLSPGKYEKGSPICSCKPGYQRLDSSFIKDYRCSFSPKGIKINDKGEIEACCGWDGNKLIVEIKRFEPS